MSFLFCCCFSTHRRLIEKLKTSLDTRRRAWIIRTLTSSIARACKVSFEKNVVFFSDPSAFRASLLVSCAPGTKVTPLAITTRVPCYVYLARLSLGYCAFHRARTITNTHSRYYCDDDSNDRMITSTWSMTNFRFFDLATLKPCGQ
jgi:hypothetical protein